MDVMRCHLTAHPMQFSCLLKHIMRLRPLPLLNVALQMPNPISCAARAGSSHARCLGLATALVHYSRGPMERPPRGT